MVFLDSGFFVALGNKSDKFHQHAKHIFSHIENGLIHPLTCDYVLDEVVTAIRTTTDSVNASNIGSHIMNKKYWLMHIVDLEIIQEAIKEIKKYDQISMSFTDWVVGLMSKRYGMRKVITVDQRHSRHYIWLYEISPVILLNNEEFKQKKQDVITGKTHPRELLLGM